MSEKSEWRYWLTKVLIALALLVVVIVGLRYLDRSLCNDDPNHEACGSDN